MNDCWWLNDVQKEGTNVSAAVTPSSCLVEMNPISPPSSRSLSLRKWNEKIGHACDKVVVSFLKQHVPAFDTKQWQPSFVKYAQEQRARIGWQGPILTFQRRNHLPYWFRTSWVLLILIHRVSATS
ncbi:hypothetical protein O181_001378 [Austropuccinia psidii MF-1]|uniref:Uncharacterized protein n=1 Tax=Austropuccinia psidii MF-1 TaxID=1389203 RepID=A0A9Q3GBN4_9BASI|nr:hypothetical protein [Austropuccinia psidii MF-1]